MKYQPPRGMRDFLPEQMIKRQFLLDKLRDIFEKWGFDPIETPALESWALLSAKSGGGEAIKDEIYYFRDKSNRELGLRFDLTVPLARAVANNPGLPKPFKRYHIGRVWRYDRPGTGRYREFWQADADILGVDSMEADAEVLALACEALESLQINDFKIRLNNRKLVENFLRNTGIKDVPAVFRSIDKLEKTGRKDVEKELIQKGVSESKISGIMKFISLRETDKIESLSNDKATIKEIRQILSILENYGYAKYISVDMSLVRGLDYYTGSVFEISLDGMSVGGGGRYDNLISLFGGRPTAAVGISFGAERVLEIMESRKLLPGKKSVVDVYIASIGTKKETIALAKELRKTGIRCDYDITGRNLDRQMEYANSRGIALVAILGQKEVEKGIVKVRNMKTGKEEELDIRNIEEMKSHL